MKHRKTAQILALGAVAALPLLASAQTADATATPAPAADAAAPAAAPAPNLTGNLELTTNYKFRGQDQDMIGHNNFAKSSWFKPAVQGGLDYVFGESGFYVGNWNSSVNWLSGNSIEMDFYGGYKMKAGIFDLDFGVYQYYYPGNTAGNTTELYGAGTYTNDAIGAFTLKYSGTVSNDYFNYANSQNVDKSGRGTGYLNLAYNKEIIPKLTIKAAVGYTFFTSDIKSFGFKDYADYLLGLSYDFGNGLSLMGSVQGGDQQSAFAVPTSIGIPTAFGPIGASTYSPNTTRFILTLTKTL
ncbi:MAG TPA: TorF family putative porin [Variovorax sp.]